MKRIFTQNDIIEIQKVAYLFSVDLKFLQKRKDFIMFYFLPNKKVKCQISIEKTFILKRTNSDGTEHYDSHSNLNNLLYFFKKWIEKIIIDNPFEIVENKFISEISPKFYNVFQEANKIYFIGLTESSGMIYRKSLEILVKDYFSYQIPEYKEMIKDRMISGIIEFFFIKENKTYIPRETNKFKKKEYNFSLVKKELANIQSLVKSINNTFKIGNDFSHYERELEKYNPIDMKKNIINIIEFIDNDNGIKLGIRKKKLQNQNFDNTELLERKRK